MRSVLWWGRFDPGYSRNQILRKQFATLGWQVTDFHPKHAGVADWEAQLRRLPTPDLVWVPCFRQRDLNAANRWASRRGVPLVFDPLISAYDKQVDERKKLHADSRQAKRLLSWERALLQRASRVIADTPAHANYFSQVLGVEATRISVIYVGADESQFKPETVAHSSNGPVEVLFFGSFIPLQGPQVVIEAAKLYRGPTTRWILLGRGPLRQRCETAARGLSNVSFEDWMPYEKLPQRIHQADILLGVFGTTPKADRVIPNKVYQALACGKPVVTRSASAYPDALSDAADSGLVWTPAGDAQALADRVAILAADRSKRDQLGSAAADTSRRFFAETQIRHQLAEVLDGLGF